MPDGERVTTGSEPIRITLARRRSTHDWQEIDPSRTWQLRSGGWQVAEFQEVVEPGHDEQTEDLKARLREAEAERDRLQRAFSAASEAASKHGGRELEFMDRAERLEAGLREAAASFDEPAIYLHPLPEGGHARLGEACGVDACILCLAETRAKVARDRARGVLEKGTGNTEHA